MDNKNRYILYILALLAAFSFTEVIVYIPIVLVIEYVIIRDVIYILEHNKYLTESEKFKFNLEYLISIKNGKSKFSLLKKSIFEEYYIEAMKSSTRRILKYRVIAEKQSKK